MIYKENGGTVWGHELAKHVKEMFPNVTKPILFEIGAYDGRDARDFKNEFPDAEIYLFEGSPKNYSKFDLANFDFGKAFIAAISNKNDLLPYYEREDGGLSGLYAREDGNNPTLVPVVNTWRLDDFVKEYKLPKPDIVKIDTEGGTYEVLEGMGDLLNSTFLLYLETEEAPYYPTQKRHAAIEAYLQMHGFECVLLHRNSGQNDSLWRKKI